MLNKKPVFIQTSKFMWDGAEYDSKEKSDEKKTEYEKLGFAVVQKEEEGKFFLYTRRVAEAAKVEEKA